MRSWDGSMRRWSYRHPWWYAAIYASSFTGVQLWMRYRYGFGAALWFLAGAWLVLFGATVGAVKWRARQLPQGPRSSSPREPVSTRPTDLRVRGDSGSAGGEDGRRWRAGSP